MRELVTEPSYLAQMQIQAVKYSNYEDLKSLVFSGYTGLEKTQMRAERLLILVILCISW